MRKQLKSSVIDEVSGGKENLCLLILFQIVARPEFA
jgi:hypothetical protein